MNQLEVLARRLDRTNATHELSGDSARILQRCDVARLGGGRMIRGSGCARTQNGPIAATVQSYLQGRTPDGGYLEIVAAGGTIYTISGDGTGGAGSPNGPHNEWAPDRQTWQGKRVEDDDFGNDEPLFSISGTETYSFVSGTGFIQADLAVFKSPIAAGAVLAPNATLNQANIWVGVRAASYYDINQITGYVTSRQGMTCGPQGVKLTSAGTRNCTLAGSGGEGAYGCTQWFFVNGGIGYTYFATFSITALQKITAATESLSRDMDPGDTLSISSNFIVRKRK